LQIQGCFLAHQPKPEEAGHIDIEKSFLERKPLTQARLTPSGRKAVSSYLGAMARLLVAHSR
jgi:hypothetical protein